MSKLTKLNLILQQIQSQSKIYYHISPFKFNKFELNKCGTGMGTSFWGYRIYFCQNEDIIDYYFDQMKDYYPTLFKYTVKINSKTLSQKLKQYRQFHNNNPKNQNLIYNEHDLLADDKTVGEIYYQLNQQYNNEKYVSQLMLQKYDVNGITYYSQEDRNSLVVFNQQIIQILNCQQIKC